MKTKLTLLFLCCTICVSLFAQEDDKAIFLHHSTGGAVFDAGVSEWISNYNTTNNTFYDVSEVWFPDWGYSSQGNYPYDYWNLWINNACGPDISPCLESLAEQYKLIIFKHCFPGSEINADTGSASVSSEAKTLENYKLQYIALRTLMSNYPNNKFIVWTLAPHHRLAISPEQANRAKEFVDWVKNDWLTEDGGSYPNIFIFDFFSLVAELSPTPTPPGVTNCLKYEYETDHGWGDGHPNATANNAVAPLFAQKIIDVLHNTPSNILLTKEEMELSIYPNPANRFIQIKSLQEIKTVSIISMDGKTLKTVIPISGKIDVSDLYSGIYLIKAKTTDGIEKTTKIAIYH